MAGRFEEPRPSEAPTATTKEEGLQPERRIGPYKVLREIGRGGMGTVYLAARADDQYQKRVAIKVVRGLDSAEVVRHFRRERQILAGLDHPNIARLLDGGTTEDGLPYFAMQFVEGIPIDRFCDEHKLSVRERLELFQGVCAAVQHAHRNLVVHRDIKPGNILVTTEGLPMLMDFGIAKLLNPEIAGEVPTATGLAMTPDYASPEQARGGPITTATDVYSLGVVLYELLTGHRPYRLRSREPLEVLKAVCEEEPERPSTAVGRTEERTLPDGTARATTAESVSRTREGTPDRLRRRLRGDLDNIVLMALRKEPQRRYGSVEAVSEDLRRYLEGLPVKAHRATAWYRASKFVRRHAFGVAAGVAVLILVVGFGVSMAVLSARVTAERDRAEREAARASAINTFLLDTLGSANPFEGQGRDTTVLEALRLAAGKLGTAFPGQPDVEARVRYTIGLTYLRLGRYADAEPMLRSAVRLLSEHYGEDSPDLPPALAALGVLRQERGDLAEAEALLRRGLATTRRLRSGTEPSSSEADILSDLALLLQERNELGEAESLMREILSNDRRTLGPEHVNVAIDLNNLGLLLVRRGRFAESEPLLREAVGIFEKADHAGLAPALGNLGEALSRTGRYQEAEPILARAVTLAAARLGEQSQDLAKARVKYGDCLLELKRYAPAEAQALAALPVLRASLGDRHEWTQRAVRLLVDVYEAWGRPIEASRYRALLGAGP
jgi:serine/threonine protein kinase/tetratricopeptide (TPR) repeat protein